MIVDAPRFGPSFVYTSTNGAEMKDNFEDKGENKFAKGQSRRDLRVNSEGRELESQLMEAIDNIGDFLRFVETSTRMTVSNQRRLF